MDFKSTSSAIPPAIPAVQNRPDEFILIHPAYFETTILCPRYYTSPFPLFIQEGYANREHHWEDPNNAKYQVTRQAFKTLRLAERALAQTKKHLYHLELGFQSIRAVY